MADRILVVAETGSTNADLRGLAEAGWPEGRWLRAERQTRGKGRLGRAWDSGAGNLAASTLVTLRPGDPPPTGLGLLAGIAAHAALLGLAPGLPAALKWPNDVMAGPAKLAGMLLERVNGHVVVGIGVNVASAPALPDRETIALADLPAGAGITAAALMEALADQFAAWLARWRAEGFEVVRAAWLAAAHPTGTPLAVSLPDGTCLTGAFRDLAVDGALIVGLEDGTAHAIHAGDVGFI